MYKTNRFKLHVKSRLLRGKNPSIVSNILSEIFGFDKCISNQTTSRTVEKEQGNKKMLLDQISVRESIPVFVRPD